MTILALSFSCREQEKLVAATSTKARSKEEHLDMGTGLVILPQKSPAAAQLQGGNVTRDSEKAHCSSRLTSSAALSKPAVGTAKNGSWPYVSISPTLEATPCECFCFPPNV